MDLMVLFFEIHNIHENLYKLYILKDLPMFGPMNVLCSFIYQLLKYLDWVLYIELEFGFGHI